MLKNIYFFIICEMWFAHIKLVIQFFISVYSSKLFFTQPLDSRRNYFFFFLKKKFDKFDVACNSIHVKGFHSHMETWGYIKGFTIQWKKPKRRKYAKSILDLMSQSEITEWKVILCWFRSRKWRIKCQTVTLKNFDEFYGFLNFHNFSQFKL